MTTTVPASISTPTSLTKGAAAEPSGSAAGGGVDPATEPAAEEVLPPVGSTIMLVSTALTILSVLLLAFVLQLVPIGNIQHARSQRLAYANLRNQLAQGIAPVGDVDSNGKPLHLGAPIALLEIPRIGVREVVGQGTTSGVLALGPGHRRDTVLPGQAGTSVILGRRAAYGGPFRRLSSLQIGDRITVTTGQGVMHFAVLDVRRAGDVAPAPPASNEGRLVLTTATGAAFIPAGVLRVDARLTSALQPSTSVSIGSSQLPADEAVMHGDPGEWLPIVLWGQVLLALVLAVVWARFRWGFWQSWLIGVPVLAAVALQVGGAVIRLLPNIM